MLKSYLFECSLFKSITYNLWTIIKVAVFQKALFWILFSFYRCKRQDKMLIPWILLRSPIEKYRDQAHWKAKTITTRQSWIAYPPPRLWTSSHGEQHLAIREAIPLFFSIQTVKNVFLLRNRKGVKTFEMKRPTPQTLDKISQEDQT